MLQYRTRPSNADDVIWTRSQPAESAHGCAYCGNADCDQAFDHARLLAGNEVHYWSAAATRRDFTARRAS